MSICWRDRFRISFGIFTIAMFLSVVPDVIAQNDPAIRLRSLNNQLLTVYGRLLSSPASDAGALHSQAADVIQQRAASIVIVYRIELARFA